MGAVSKLEFGQPYRRKDGQAGAQARIDATHPDGWRQTYTFDTHGMNPEQVAARVATVETYHEAKAARLTGFRSVQGQIVNSYRIVDCTIHDADVTLYLDVRGSDGGVVQGFPIRRKYLSMEQIPSNDAILEIVRKALPEPAADLAEKHAAFVAAVHAKRGA